MSATIPGIDLEAAEIWRSGALSQPVKDGLLLHLIIPTNQRIMHPLHKPITLRQVILFLVGAIGVVYVTVVTVTSH